MKVKFIKDSKNLVKESADDFEKDTVRHLPDDIAKKYIDKGSAIDTNGLYLRKEKKDKE